MDGGGEGGIIGRGKKISRYNTGQDHRQGGLNQDSRAVHHSFNHNHNRGRVIITTNSLSLSLHLPTTATSSMLKTRTRDTV